MTTLASAIKKKADELQITASTKLAREIGIAPGLLKSIQEEGKTSFNKPSAAKLAKFLGMNDSDFDDHFPRTKGKRGRSARKGTNNKAKRRNKTMGRTPAGIEAAINLLQDDLAALVNEASPEQRKMIRAFLTTT